MTDPPWLLVYLGFLYPGRIQESWITIICLSVALRVKMPPPL